MEMLRAQIVSNKIEVFEREEKLMVEHKLGIQCFDVEELLQDGVSLYGDICRVDHAFHSFVLSTPEAYNPDLDRQIGEQFSRWSRVVKRVFSFFETIRDDYVERGFDMKRHAALAKCYSECLAILSPSAVETSLADDAIEEHRSGLTISML